MQVDVSQERRSATPLRRPFLHQRSLPILQHAGVQPFLDEPRDAPVRDAVLDELHRPAVVDGIEEATDVQVEHPVHLSRQQSDIERIERLVLVASRPEAIGEAEEVGFVDGVQHRHGRALDDLVFQRGYTERPLPPVRFGDVHPTNRLGPVRAAFEPLGQVLEIALQRLAVVPPLLSIHAGCGFSLQGEIGHLQHVRVVDVVQERRELRLPISTRCLTYPLERTVRVASALCPSRVLLWQVPFGQAPSLHLLRRRWLGLVRRLPRYCWPVRLPVVVHRRRASLDFPTRPMAPSAVGNHRISRFPSMVFPYVLGVSDRAEPSTVSRYRRCGFAFRISLLRRRSGGSYFRGSIPGPHVPLSTLRRHPCGRCRMTRGRSGSLFLHRMTLSFTTPCRFDRRTRSAL